MARRHLTFTLTFTLDEDTVRHHETFPDPHGDTPYTDTIDLLRTALHHQAAMILSPYDPQLGNPEVEMRGIDYEPDNSAYEPI